MTGFDCNIKHTLLIHTSLATNYKVPSLDVCWIVIGPDFCCVLLNINANYRKKLQTNRKMR